MKKGLLEYRMEGERVKLEYRIEGKRFTRIQDGTTKNTRWKEKKNTRKQNGRFT